MTLETQNKWITFLLALHLVASLSVLVMQVMVYDRLDQTERRVTALENHDASPTTPQ